MTLQAWLRWGCVAFGGTREARLSKRFAGWATLHFEARKKLATEVASPGFGLKLLRDFYVGSFRGD